MQEPVNPYTTDEHPEFSGYDEQGKPMYLKTADGPVCFRCDGTNGEHQDGCPNSDG